MKHYTVPELRSAVDSVGLAPGDAVVVHSALFPLGRLADVAPAEVPGTIRDALLAHLGPAGTLVVPAFNFGFCRGEPYDPQATPSAGMGQLSEAVRTAPGAFRGCQPMQSVAAIGRHAEALCALDTPDAFEPGGVFDRMVNGDFKLLLLGASVQSVSLVHYAERQLGVPYRHFKSFAGPYSVGGETSTRTYCMYVRDLTRDPQLVWAPIAHALATAGQWREARLGGGRVASCLARDFFAVAAGILRADPWGLVDGGDG